MKLLHANDRAGEYPASWYAASAQPLPPFDPLDGDTQADVCVIGGGFTGLSAALHLAQSGVDVVLLEAHRAGFGASGRNGGQVGSGMRKDQDEMERLFGREDALKFWQIAEGAKALVKSLIAEHGINAAWRDGIAHADWSAKGAAETQDYARWLQDRYEYLQAEPLDRDQIRALIPSQAYHGGMVDWGAGHIHPLRFALGLAQAAQAAGARIYERSQVTAITGSTVRTATGTVAARHIVLATNGYHDGLEPRVARRVLPINNFIVATEPLGERAATVLTKDVAVGDSKFVVNYWRLSEDKRLLFGGGESYGDRFPADLTAIARKPMLEVYPHLRDVKIDYAWGGTLAITPTRLPDFSRHGALWSAAGYSGHGVALATYAGRMMAEAIRGEASEFDLMGKLRPPAFPGMGALRRPILNLAMRWFALRDRLGF
ncbi:Oxidoreductase [Candidatus Rhodobacter oscarellae]|uniref:Oxidoreductase n=1 Tax=Candidatus Rhodobacter oscarellae TaxID=1675527 RepID=A0A0J9H5D9_9RHOB|nr:FAD-binding oxidoreductase [Candidatus Rhodobacter lobularis]KMW60803.1 Oxidoreductase [Candidatus Rhodobacter lobularis]